MLVVSRMSLLVPVLFLAVFSGCEAETDDEGNNGYMDVSVAQAKALIDSESTLVVIDVSPVWDEGHIPGAMSYPVGSGALDAAIPMLDKNAKYLVYCHADGPSIQGARKLVDAGFDPVYRLVGNYEAWVDAGYSIETGPM